MMTRKTMIPLALALAALAVAPGRGTSAADASGWRHFYGMAGLAAGQTLRLNATHTLPPGPSRDELPPGPIRVRFALLDDRGRVLASLRSELQPGHSDALEISFGRLGIDARRVHVRAVVDVILPPSPILPPGPVRNPSVSTLEVFDDDSARTSLFVHPAVVRGFNPQPDPPID
jgi:hypothetical protein